MANIFIHIGMPKTASTSMQKMLKINEYAISKQFYIPKSCQTSEIYINHSNLFCEFSGDSRFKPDLGNFNNLLNEIKNVKKDIILSSEDFSLLLLNDKHKFFFEKSLKDLNFTLKKGELLTVLGPSGCGKTTLLHLLSGLLRPNSGDVDVENENISKMSGARLDNFRGANIGVVFQTPHFIEALTVKENLTLTQTLAGKSKDIDKVERLLADLGVESKLNSKLNALSVGEKQRVSIARALVNSPALILADEPTSALDNKNCDAVLKLVREQAKKHNSTLLIVTHDNRLKDQFDKRIEL